MTARSVVVESTMTVIPAAARRVRAFIIFQISHE